MNAANVSRDRHPLLEAPSHELNQLSITTRLSLRQPPTLPRRSQRSPNGFREIHKNAWLRRYIPQERRSASALLRKYEKLWVVFCVHDDLEPFLEFYNESKTANLHNPTEAVSLKSCLHVSPTIAGQDKDFEFAVTFPETVIRLMAASWDQMIEWVESLQGKLREMSIICPKHNLYSRLPEAPSHNPVSRTPSGTTRDPNSPLPPPPPVVPGIRNLVSEEDSETGRQESISTGEQRQINANTTASRAVPGPSRLLDRQNSGPEAGRPAAQSESTVVLRKVDRTLSDCSAQTLHAHRMRREKFSSNSVSERVLKFDTELQVSSSRRLSNTGTRSYSAENGTTSPSRARPSSTPNQADKGLSAERQRCKSSENLYEYLFIPEVTSSVNANLFANNNVHAESVRRNKTGPQDTNGCGNSSDMAPPILPRRPHSSGKFRSVHGCGNPPRSSSLNRLRIEDCSVQSKGPSLDGTLSNTPAGDEVHAHAQQDTTRETTGAIRDSNDRPLEAMIGIRAGEYRIRRDETIAMGTSAVDGSMDAFSSSRNMPLKEQQVLRLKWEMAHHAGVRVVLKKKDCVSSLALIDYLGAVWVAGWKQRQFPVLYYAFHVGDQIVKVAGVTVQNSFEAQRAIKLSSSMQVEFIIRRIPYGRVLVLKRSTEGEPLGIVAIGNSAEIGEVLTNSLAASQGLPPAASSLEGLAHTCNWFLTEINNRPLNLFAKEGEVRDRCNAVGKEISILVQPADLIKQMRKHLKEVKSYKDYLVS